MKTRYYGNQETKDMLQFQFLIGKMKTQIYEGI